MSAEVMISSTELPDNRNFTLLKTQGLNYLKQLSGTDWTDFNESDPGVTILDQLCYALTELGYCNNFPIEDIVCRHDGKIEFKNQFFTPDKILTTRPITIIDYRKLIIDATPQLANVYLSCSASNHHYKVDLYVNESVRANMNSHSKPSLDELCLKVDRLLSQNRTVGEYFAPAVVLKPQPIEVSGRVMIDSSARESQVRANIQLALADYISPVINQLGYREMLNAGFPREDIFDGPRLKNGWIPDRELAVAKKSTVCPQQILSIIGGIEGATVEQNLRLNGSESKITIQPENIAQFSIEQLSLYSSAAPSKAVPSTVVPNTAVPNTAVPNTAVSNTAVSNTAVSNTAVSNTTNNPLNTDLQIGKLRAQHAAIKIGSSVELHPPQPRGKYREIGKYYSVQNTFPSMYGLAEHSLPADATPSRVAQARQLKGYLTIFDQLLANQFSQLEKVSDLFSFKPWHHTAPLKHSAFSRIPSRLFSPTYHFQPLYDIRGVKHLLIGHDSYLFDDGSSETQDSKVLKHQAWEKYKRDPFNQYLSGLRDCMENNTQADQRHEAMLDHLLARHGESGSFYNEIVLDPYWYGSVRKSRIIVKSLLLQNYQLLSYNRCKAYSFSGADRLGTPGRYRITQTAFDNMNIKRYSSNVLEGLRLFINCGFPSRQGLITAFEKKLHCKLHPGQVRLVCRHMADGNAAKHKLDYNDGRLDLNSIEAAAHLRPTEFVNYSSFELQCNLVLQLSLRYRRLSALLRALINYRRFTDWLCSNSPENDFKVVYHGMQLTVRRTVDSNQRPCDQVQLDKENMLSIVHDGVRSIAVYQAHKDQLDWLAEQRQGMVFIENIQLLNSLPTSDVAPTLSYYDVHALFPDYVNHFSTTVFTEQLRKLMESHMPAYICPRPNWFSFSKLSDVISDYINWHNNWLKNQKFWGPRDYQITQRLLLSVLSKKAAQS